MAVAHSLDTSVPAVTATWAAGLISIAADTEQLFAAFPMLGFAMLGCIGGFVGWCLAIEQGKTDLLSNLQSLALLGRRVSLGAGVGLASWLIWMALGGTEKGDWMLFTGACAVAPVEAVRWVMAKVKAVAQ
jgi:hypothetical protein